MNKICLAFCLVITASVFAVAQTDYKKSEFFIGYSNNQVENGSLQQDSSGKFTEVRDGYNGFEISGVGNVNRYIGVKGDFSAHYRKSGNTRSSLYNFLGGLQIKDNATDGSRFRPFGHALVGVGRTRFGVDSSFLTSPVCAQPGIVCTAYNNTRSGFAAAIGGGLDIKASKRISVRAFQVDYNPIHPDTNTKNNLRFGFGLVFH